jgi:hypothetical protein
MSKPDTDVAASVLGRMEAAERNFRIALFAAVAFEGALLVAFILAIDLSNREHVLLLLMLGGVLTMGALGFAALGAFVRRNTLRVLQAVETVRRSG